MIIVGIDVGVTGALAALDRDGRYLAVFDLPVIRDAKLAWIDGDALLSQLIELRQGRTLHATVERLHAMPKNGSQAAFSQGCTLGSVLATLQAARVSVSLVTPNAWKKALNLGSDKQASLDRARMLYPDAPLDRVKDHNRAEALLIAHFAMNRRTS